ncbi:ABC transporter ATP-binding protein [Bacillus mesophilum]|uniref:ABC transporter ATP-binding protein n=1 Tax=Bacillus mesophilum TaxID=1071718 RepID=A0A7V7RQF0_9BACI|nr:ABC transporter ATP-binding protein [Bacillus mesophilum]KAB2335659.1 ABC transporter ATP-binding protein [Bacillus mesophilum]
MLKLTKQLTAYKWMILSVFALIFIQVLSDLYLPTLMADIIDNGVVVGDTGVIWRVGGIMLAVSALGAIASVGASYYASKSAMGFGRDLRRKVFKHVDEFSMQDFDSVGTASLITRTTNDITQIQQVVIMMLRMVVSAPIMFVGGLIMAVSKDPKLSLIILVTMPILAVSIYFIMKKALPLFKLVQDKLDRLNLVMRENLTGIRVIRAFNREKQEKDRLQKANSDLTDVSIKVNRIMAFLMPVLMLIMNLTVVAVIWFGGIRIDNGGMQVGDLMAFIQYITQMMFALIMASMMFIMIPRASVSAQRINEVLELEPTFVDQGSTQADQEKGTLSFEDVTFHYPGAEEPALSHISFKANPGEVTAIIGGTGAGKSTLVNLIPRFYDITSGVIRINGVDVRNASQESVRSKIGLVPQKALLFTGSITENIKYGKEDATEDEVKHASMVAQAHEFISKMEQGYDTMLAQGGSNLSGGQKQRLSIARALVRKPDVYIFDDSFSALDYKTDKNLRAALKEETKDATVILVAQRISTVVDADRIIVLDKGTMAGIGTHKQLMEENEVYREIVKSQSSEEETA